MIKSILFFLALSGMFIFTSGCLRAGPDSFLNSAANDSVGPIPGAGARFAVLGDNLYTVSGNKLNVYDIKNPNTPKFLTTAKMDDQILTINSYNDSILLIGYASSNVNLYKVANSFSPVLVIYLMGTEPFNSFALSNHYLFTATHRGRGPTHFNFENSLDYYDIGVNGNPINATKTIRFPLGMASNKNDLYVCDTGLKVFDISNIQNIALKKHFDIEANSIMTNGNNLMILGKTALFQYQYANDTINMLSKIKIVTP